MTLLAEHYSLANWPAPARVRTLVTTRLGGVSTAPFDSLNPALHVGDDRHHVDANRQTIASTLNQLGDVSAIQWLNQTHSTDVIHSDHHTVNQTPNADACTTITRNIACAVMTADCLPLLLCRQDGSAVAACHAGWRGLLDGVIEQTAQQLAGNRHSPIMVWLGPAISQACFEVGAEVRQQFLTAAGNQQQATDACFIAGDSANNPDDKYLADLYQLARIRLLRLSIDQIYGGDLCTFSDPHRFYSYRRDGQTGRLASIIWLE